MVDVTCGGEEELVCLFQPRLPFMLKRCGGEVNVGNRSTRMHMMLSRDRICRLTFIWYPISSISIRMLSMERVLEVT